MSTNPNDPASPTIPDTSHGRIFALLERLGVSYGTGKAVEELLEAADCETPEDRCSELLQSALARLTGGGPVYTRADPVDSPVDKPAPPPESAPRPEPAKRRTPGRPRARSKGHPHGYHVCPQCGQKKGETAFPKGQPGTCRKCLGTAIGRPAGPPAKPAPGQHQRPGTERVCVKCGKRKSTVAFPGNGDTCRLCLNPAAEARKPTLTGKRCKGCGEMRPIGAYEDGADKCRSCASMRVIRPAGNGADGGA